MARRARAGLHFPSGNRSKTEKVRQIDYVFVSDEWTSRAWVNKHELVRSGHRQLAGLVIMGSVVKKRKKDGRRNYKGFGYEVEEGNPYSEKRLWEYRDKIEQGLKHTWSRERCLMVWGVPLHDNQGKR